MKRDASFRSFSPPTHRHRSFAPGGRRVAGRVDRGAVRNRRAGALQLFWLRVGAGAFGGGEIYVFGDAGSALSGPEVLEWNAAPWCGRSTRCPRGRSVLLRQTAFGDQLDSDGRAAWLCRSSSCRTPWRCSCSVGTSTSCWASCSSPAERCAIPSDSPGRQTVRPAAARPALRPGRFPAARRHRRVVPRHLGRGSPDGRDLRLGGNAGPHSYRRLPRCQVQRQPA